MRQDQRARWMGWLPWNRQGVAPRRFPRSSQRRTASWAAFGPELLESRRILASDLVISEFLATNVSGLRDADGDPSDWIEVHNRGNDPVDLGGWRLTDERDQLDKWRFPDMQLAGGRSVLVFASGKNRDAAGAELHANFRLSGSGEYLALVSPDGSTIVDQFDPYPLQYADVSYGREQLEKRTVWVEAGTASRLLLPSSAAEDVPAATWTGVGFDASSWSSAPAAVGFDQNKVDGDFLPLIAPGGEISRMAGRATSAYVRSEFSIDGVVPGLDQLQLQVQADDGYVAYLNGTEVGRSQAADPLAWNSVATRDNGASGANVVYADFMDPDHRDDFTLVGSAAWQGARLQLTPPAVSQTGAAWLTQPVRFGADYSFTATMKVNAYQPGGPLDIDGRGGHGMTFVLQSNGPNRLGGGGGSLGLDGSGMTFVAVELDTYASGAFDPDGSMGTHIGIDTSSQGNVARVAVNRFNGDPAFPNQPGPGVDLRYVWLEYQGGAKRLDVFFSAVPDKPATPTLSATVDFQQLFGGVNQLWAGWTAATAEAFNGQDVLSFQMSTGGQQAGLTVQTLDLRAAASLLRSGSNVLALHGLNSSLASDDFLLRPELVGVSRAEGGVQYFSRPTPGKVNGLGDAPPVGSVLFSTATKTFSTPFDLVLTPPNPRATIRYTTNGDVPSETSALYTGPLRIASTAKIRARAFEAGKGPGPTQSESFLLVDGSLTNFERGAAFTSNLPVLVFESFNRNVDSQNTLMVPVSTVFIDPGADGKASILDEAVFGGRAGMRIRGQTSEGFAKKQYALELWDELNSDTRTWDAGAVVDKSASFFGLPAESDWVLNGPFSDKTQLNNYLTFLWSNKIGLYAPRARLVELFLNQDGGALNYAADYRGTYVLLEKIKRDNDRVDIAELTPDMNSFPDISGGYIWKKDKPGAGDVPFSTSRGQEFRMVEPDDRTVTSAQRSWLQSYLNQFEAALYGPNFADPVNGYAKYIDVDSWAETWLLVEFTKNIDGFRLSTYYHKDRNGKIEQGPAWDYNLSLGNANYFNGAFPTGWYGDQLGDGDYPYWRRLFEDPKFRQRVVDRWNELRQGPWSTEALLSDIDAAVQQLSNGNPLLDRPATGEPSNPISRNFRRWTNVATYEWPNCYFGQGGCPPSPLPGGRAPQRYADYLFLLKNFVTQRAAWIDSQLPAGPAFRPTGGLVAAGTRASLDVPAGWEAYYSLDGSDPGVVAGPTSEKILSSGTASAESIVPADARLITACSGAVLLDSTRCFMNPDYVTGTLGETWKTGLLGVGYDREPTYVPYIGTDVRAAMDGVAPSVYVRVPFDVTTETLATLQDLKLRVRYDDGFVAYLWSADRKLPVEVARRNAAGDAPSVPIAPLAYNQLASANRNDADAVVYETIDLTAYLPYLRAGKNVLVLQGLNGTVASSDFLLQPELAGTVRASGPVTGAQKYSTPIVIERNSRVQARMKRIGTTAWSGLSEATFLTAIPAVVVSEINYHPAAPTTAELAAMPGIEDGDFEFVEMYNPGTTPADLVGTRLAGAVDFTFPSLSLAPGEYAVVVADAAAFRLRYGNAARVLGVFEDGSLDNGGETLRVVDALGGEIGVVAYADSSLWPQRADGVGATLELVDVATPRSEWSKPARWSGSARMHGTPGKAAERAPAIVINEVLSNPDPRSGLGDAIELFNAGSAIVDVGGWLLSDSSQTLRKYQVPAGIQLGPGQYLVLGATQFNPTPDTPAPTHFALSGAQGDDVWLTIPAPDGSIAFFVDDAHFGPMPMGESIGRVQGGGGSLQPLQQVSLARPNGAPRVGPVLVSELMYQPAPPGANTLLWDPTVTPDDLEYIEIANPTTQEIKLNGWRLRGGVDFDFRSDARLAAGSSLLVLPFDPADAANRNRVAAFRVQYGLDASVPLVGPYRGQLANEGDRVVLQRPQESGVVDPAVVPRYLEDEVVYDNSAPWPTGTPGTPWSLQRTSATGLGIAAASWKSAAPQPGLFPIEAGTKGDFNGDQKLDVADVDAFAVGYRALSSDSRFDVNGDRRLDDFDRDYLVRQLMMTDYGDSNLDRIFDSADLIQVFQPGQYEDREPLNSGWATGDWNMDGDFDSGDMVLAFQAGAYVPAARPVASRAAEPLSDVAAALGPNAWADDGEQKRVAESEFSAVWSSGAAMLGKARELEAAVVESLFADSTRSRSPDVDAHPGEAESPE